MRDQGRTEIVSTHMAFWAFIAGVLFALGGMVLDACPSTITDAEVKYDICYGRAGGQRLYLDLYTPLELKAPAPLAVWVHGGGWVMGSKAQLGPGADELVKHGFMVASLDYRLAPAHPWPAQFSDVKRALRFLCVNADRYMIDTHRIGLWGGSAGGHLVSLIGLTGIQADGAAQVQRVNAVVDFCGPSDLLASDFPEPLQRIMEAVFPPGPRRSQMLRDASPVEYISADAPPFLIIHGEYDNLVPLAQARLFYERLKNVGVPVELVIVSNAGHGFQPVKGEPSLNRVQMGRLVMEFFEKKLQSGSAAPGRKSLIPESSIP